MALKRVSKSLKYEKQKIRQTINLSGLTIRSNLVEFTYANSDTMTEKPKQVFTISEKKKRCFLQYITRSSRNDDSCRGRS